MLSWTRWWLETSRAGKVRLILDVHVWDFSAPFPRDFISKCHERIMTKLNDRVRVRRWAEPQRDGRSHVDGAITLRMRFCLRSAHVTLTFRPH